jgi:vanillate O-demethylase monooxygenase subunit
MALFTGAVASGRPRGEGITVPSAHLFTPESSHSTHYFYAMSFPRAVGEAAAQLAESAVASLRAPFEFEDKPIVEAVARNMAKTDLLSLNPVLLAGDAAAIKARRVLRAKIESESNSAESG